MQGASSVDSNLRLVSRDPEEYRRRALHASAQHGAPPLDPEEYRRRAEGALAQAAAEGLTLSRSSNSSGFMGVSFQLHKTASKHTPYMARYSRTILGWYATAEEGALEYARMHRVVSARAAGRTSANDHDGDGGSKAAGDERSIGGECTRGGEGAGAAGAGRSGGAVSGAKGHRVRLELKLRRTDEMAPCRAVYVGTSLRAVEAAAPSRARDRRAVLSAPYGTAVPMTVDDEASAVPSAEGAVAGAARAHVAAEVTVHERGAIRLALHVRAHGSRKRAREAGRGRGEVYKLVRDLEIELPEIGQQRQRQGVNRLVEQVSATECY